MIERRRFGFEAKWKKLMEVHRHHEAANNVIASPVSSFERERTKNHFCLLMHQMDIKKRCQNISKNCAFHHFQHLFGWTIIYSEDFFVWKLSVHTEIHWLLQFATFSNFQKSQIGKVIDAIYTDQRGYLDLAMAVRLGWVRNK